MLTLSLVTLIAVDLGMVYMTAEEHLGIRGGIALLCMLGMTWRCYRALRFRIFSERPPRFWSTP
jgi:hypothetical protein